jgi:hypothetical protein
MGRGVGPAAEICGGVSVRRKTEDKRTARLERPRRYGDIGNRDIAVVSKVV